MAPQSSLWISLILVGCMSTTYAAFVDVPQSSIAYRPNSINAIITFPVPQNYSCWKATVTLSSTVSNVVPFNAILDASQPSSSASVLLNSNSYNAALAAGSTLSLGFTANVAVTGAISMVSAQIDPCAAPTSSITSTVTTKTSTATITPTSTTPSPTSNRASTTTSSASPTTSPSPSARKRVVAYYASWDTYARNFQVADIAADKIDFINYAFANIAGGECVLGDSYADTEKFFPATDDWNVPEAFRGNFKQLNVLKSKYPQLKTILSVGGWTWSTGFSDAAATAASRERFATSCVAMMLKYGFDGLDLDWEYPVEGGNGIPHRDQDGSNLSELLRLMRQKLDQQSSLQSGRRFYLTIASGANPLVSRHLELNVLNQVLDWVNIMSYDFHGAFDAITGHNAPLYKNPNDPSSDPVVRNSFNVDAAVQSYLNGALGSMDPSKIVIGMPFYGRGWQGVHETDAGRTTPGLFLPGPQASKGTWEDGVLDYDDLVNNYIGKNNYVRYWDPYSMVPYLFNIGSGVFISYDDPESIGLKSQYVLDHNLGGAMIWELSSDRSHRLLDVINAKLRNGPVPPAPTTSSTPSTTTVSPSTKTTSVAPTSSSKTATATTTATTTPTPLPTGSCHSSCQAYLGHKCIPSTGQCQCWYGYTGTNAGYVIDAAGSYRIVADTCNMTCDAYTFTQPVPACVGANPSGGKIM